MQYVNNHIITTTFQIQSNTELCTYVPPQYKDNPIYTVKEHLY